MNNIRIIFFFFFIALEAVGQQHQRLTLEEAIKLGLENSKSLKISGAKVEAAQAKYHQALDAALPSVTASASYQLLSDLEPPKILFPGAAEPVAIFPVYINNYSTKLSANEIVFSGFRAKYAEESLQLLLQASKLDADQNKDEITFTIIQEYYNLYKIKETEKIITDNLDAIKQHVKETQLGAQQGVAIQNDLLRWQLQQSNIELTQLDIENNRDVANYNMNLLLGLNDIQIDVDSNSIHRLNEEKTLSDYLARASTSRSDLQAIHLRTQAAEKNLKVSENSFLPQIGVGGNLYDLRPNPRIIPPKNEFTFTWDVGLFFSWDLMRLYSNRHIVDEAKAVLSQNKESMNQLSDALKMEVNQNYLSWKQSNQRIAVLQKSVEQAEENYRITNSRYKNNLVLMSELLDADNALYNSKINLALAKADAQVAYYRLVKSTGGIK
jgi:outer membrane protein TolC